MKFNTSNADIVMKIIECDRNSISVQAAQVMLAQANQMPEGVLQLFQ
jgi:flagellin-like hook-associated protein FlgL